MQFRIECRHVDIHARRVLFCPGYLLAVTKLLIQPSANSLNFSRMARTSKDRFIGRKSLRPNYHGHKTRRILHRKDHEAHATICTRISVRGVNVRGIRHARIVSSFHLRRSERHGFLRPFRITSAEERGEGLFVALLPRVRCRGVDDVYQWIEW